MAAAQEIMSHRSLSNIHELTMVAIGTALGWFLAPAGYQRVGLAVGAAVGILLGSTLKWWLLKQYGTEAALPLPWWGHALYLVGVCLCAYLVSMAAISWIRYPETWIAALAAVLFFGAGAVVLFVLWVCDRRALDSTAIEPTRHLVLGVSSFILATASVFVILLGNIIIGFLGTLFFFLCGVVLLKKARGGGEKVTR